MGLNYELPMVYQIETKDMPATLALNDEQDVIACLYLLGAELSRRSVEIVKTRNNILKKLKLKGQYKKVREEFGKLLTLVTSEQAQFSFTAGLVAVVIGHAPRPKSFTDEMWSAYYSFAMQIVQTLNPDVISAVNKAIVESGGDLELKKLERV